MPTATAVPSMGGKFNRSDVNYAEKLIAPPPTHLVSTHLVKYSSLEDSAKSAGEPCLRQSEAAFFDYDQAADFARALVRECRARADSISIYELMSVEVTVGVQPRGIAPERIR